MSMTINDGFDESQVRHVGIATRGPNGSWQVARGHRGHQITMSYESAVARGMIDGAEAWSAYGERTTSGAESNILWPNGTYALPSAAGVQPSLKSSSPNDTAAGTGVRTVDVHYLDTNLTRQLENVALNGATDVPMVTTDVRFIECLHMRTYGSGKAASGTIDCHVGAQVYSQIVAGGVRCSSSVRMTPAGKRAVITGMYGGAISGAAAASVKMYMATCHFDGHDYTADSIFFPIGAGAFQDGSGGMTFDPPLVFEEGAAFAMSFVTDKAGTIVGSWFGYLEDV
jgi:hypothetical protein